MDGGVVAALWGQQRRQQPFLHRNLKKVLRGSDPNYSEGRPAKRQKISPGPEPVLSAKRNKQDVGIMLKDSQPPAPLVKALRIDITGIAVKSGNVSKSKSVMPESGRISHPMRCKIAIYRPLSEGIQYHDELVRLSQLGTIETSYSGDENVARVSLPAPFIIMADSLYYNKTDKDGTETFGLGDDYLLLIWLEGINPRTNWPPLEMEKTAMKDGRFSKQIQASNLRRRDIVLTCKTENALFAHPGFQYLELGMKLQRDAETTPYALRVDIKWSVPAYKQRTMAPLSQLSPLDGPKSTTSVTWTLVNLGSMDIRKAHLKDFTCAICHRSLSSCKLLRFHVVTSHDEFTFSFEKPSRRDSYFIISFAKKSRRREVIENGIIQLALPRKKFDIENYFNGDISWITSREGPDNASCLPWQNGSSTSSSESESLRSSPITSVDMDLDLDEHLKDFDGASANEENGTNDNHFTIIDLDETHVVDDMSIDSVDLPKDAFEDTHSIKPIIMPNELPKVLGQTSAFNGDILSEVVGIPRKEKLTVMSENSKKVLKDSTSNLPGLFVNPQTSQKGSGMPNQENGRMGPPEAPREPSTAISEVHLLSNDSVNEMNALFKTANAMELDALSEPLDEISKEVDEQMTDLNAHSKNMDVISEALRTAPMPARIIDDISRGDYEDLRTRVKQLPRNSAVKSKAKPPHPPYHGRTEEEEVTRTKVNIEEASDSLVQQFPILVKKLTAPDTDERLFDTITKRRLLPGAELGTMESRWDLSWKLKKHADIINDYTDLSDDEKDYIIRWDTFMIPMNITAKAYFPEAVRRFLEQNLDWFAERDSRFVECGKHLTSRLLAGNIDMKCMRECSAIMRVAATKREERSARDEAAALNPNVRNKGKQVARDESSQREHTQPRYRGPTDCSCGEHVTAYNAVICSRDECSHSFYHRKCVSNPPPKGRKWFCETCLVIVAPRLRI